MYKIDNDIKKMLSLCIKKRSPLERLDVNILQSDKSWGERIYVSVSYSVYSPQEVSEKVRTGVGKCPSAGILWRHREIRIDIFQVK